MKNAPATNAAISSTSARRFFPRDSIQS